MGKIKDLTGQRFGRLVVLELLPRNSKGARWLCKCDCGNIKEVASSCLVSGRTRSCGCLSTETHTTHGLRNHPLYKRWIGIKNRCDNNASPDYPRYGGRGIKVCDEWAHNFKSFYDWSISNGYQNNLSIDRIDVNGDYEPNNCRWVDTKTQSRNTRSNHYIEYNGEKHCLKEWAEILDIDYATLKNRVRHNWDVNRIMNEPVHKEKRRY